MQVTPHESKMCQRNNVACQHKGAIRVNEQRINSGLEHCFMLEPAKCLIELTITLRTQ